jgi:hypothetical protein
MGKRIYYLEERLINYALKIIDIAVALPNAKVATHLGEIWNSTCFKLWGSSDCRIIK